MLSPTLGAMATHTDLSRGNTSYGAASDDMARLWNDLKIKVQQLQQVEQSTDAEAIPEHNSSEDVKAAFNKSKRRVQVEEDETKNRKKLEAQVEKHLNKEKRSAWKKLHDSLNKRLRVSTEREVADRVEKTSPPDTVDKASERLTRLAMKTVEGLTFFGGKALNAAIQIAPTALSIGAGVADSSVPFTVASNLVSFVIKVWTDYEGMFTALDTMLQQCAAFLDRFDDLKESQHRSVQNLCCGFLQLFIDICDATILLSSSKSHKARELGNLASGGDTAIEKIKAKMKQLLEAESLAVAAATHNNTEKVLNNKRRSIAKALGFADADLLDAMRSPKDTWEQALNRRFDRHIPKIGDWMPHLETYKDWSFRKDGAPILLLQGSVGSGKTSLVASLIKRAQRQDQYQYQPRQGAGTQSSSRPVVAYFFADTSKKKAADDDLTSWADQPYAEIARVLLWQLFNFDEAMTRMVYARLASKPPSSIGGVSELWEVFFEVIENQEKGFLIFIDAPDVHDLKIQQLKDHFAKKQNKESKGWAHLLMTVTQRPDRPPTTGACKIVSVSDHLKADLDIFIAHMVGNWKRSTSEDANNTRAVAQLGEIMIRELRKHLGSGRTIWKYDNASKVIKKVLHAVQESDVIEILRECRLEEEAELNQRLTAVGARLREGEILELSEIAIWVEFAYDWLTVQELEVVVAMNGRCIPNSATGAETRKWFVPFMKAKLDQKYSDFFSVNPVDDYVQWAPGISITDITNPQHTPEPIQAGELEMVRHILQTLVPQSVYRRFKFAEFFEGLEASSAGSDAAADSGQRFKLDEPSSHLKIALKCLTILTDKTLHCFESLRNYAAENVLRHLHSVTEIGDMDSDAKAKLGQLLARLCTERSVIEALFWSDDIKSNRAWWEANVNSRLREARKTWVQDREAVAEISRWLKDSNVAESFRNGPAQEMYDHWLEGGVSSLYKALLSSWATDMARLFFLGLHQSNREVLAAMEFIVDCLQGIGEIPTADSEESLEDDDEDDTIPGAHLITIEKWALEALRDELDSDAKRSRWHANFVNAIIEVCPDYDDTISKNHGDDGGQPMTALNRAQEAVRLEPSNLLGCIMLALTDEDHPREALQQLKGAHEAVARPSVPKDGEAVNGEIWSHVRVYARTLLTLAQLEWDCENYEEAARQHRQSLEYGYVGMWNWAIWLEAYRERNDWSRVIELVQALSDSSGNWKQHMADFEDSFVNNECNPMQTIVTAANHETTADCQGDVAWKVVQTFFNAAVPESEDPELSHLRALILEYASRALAMANSSNFRDEAVTKREEAWRELISGKYCYAPPGVRSSIIDSLAEVYLDRGSDSKWTKEETAKTMNSIEDLVRSPKEASMGIVPLCCLIRLCEIKDMPWPAVVEGQINAIVQDGINLLSDKDESNDDSAFQMLARIFTTLEDQENIVACWKMRRTLWYRVAKMNRCGGTLLEELGIGRDRRHPSQELPQAVPKEVSREQSDNGSEGVLGDIEDASSDAEEDNQKVSDHRPAPLIQCSACDKDVTFEGSELWTCVDCGGRRQYDGVCKARLKDQQLDLSTKRRIPCSSHKLIPLPAWDEQEAQGWKKESILLNDGLVITLNEWKDQLREKYLSKDLEARLRHRNNAEGGELNVEG